MKLPEVLGDSASSLAPFLLRVLAAPNLLFPAMLFLLWRDEGKNAAFKPLMLLGKAVSFTASILFLPRLLGFGTSELPARLSNILAILACMLVDALTVIILITMRKPEGPAAPIAADQTADTIETVVDN